MGSKRWLARAGLMAALLAALPSPAPSVQPGQRPLFANGFPQRPGFFPIAVWLQGPHNAAAYRAIGINTYIGLWETPTEAHLALLERYGLHLILKQTPAALALPNAHVIRAWIQPDEPDNAQWTGIGYGDCIMPEEVVRQYQEMRAMDPTRPVFLNFGQAVANPQWFGRGRKCSKISPETYYTAASRGADIVSFDVYPAAEERQAHVMGRLELVGRGVANLARWSAPGRPVWSAIETTHINHPSRRPLPHEVRSEVWMALVNGASGIFYFVHEWKPSFREDALFRYPDTVQEIGRINAQIAALAPVLNSPTLAGRVRVEAPVEIATMVKRHGDAHYLFAVNMEKKAATARLVLTGIGGTPLALGEQRAVTFAGGAIEEEFAEYGVRLYKIPIPE
jgi:hypothetical protein